MYAEIIVDISHSNIDRIFDYRIPDHMNDDITKGMRVLIPFGNQKKPIEGYVIGLKDQVSYNEKKIKEIIKLVDPYPVILPELLSMAIWMKQKYHCNLVDSLRLMIPSQMRGQRVKVKKIKTVKLLNKHLSKKDAYRELSGNATKQRAILEYLLLNPEKAQAELIDLFPGSLSSIKSLAAKGWVEIVEEEALRKPYETIKREIQANFTPTKHQAKAIQQINDAVEGGKGSFLLHGVTGSGKTEIYLQCIQHALMNGKNAIVLVPEISLTPQMVERFRRRFGDSVAVLHSKLSPGERFDEWRRIREHRVKVVVGARSAVFAPFDQLGLIIIDEEHENSYRSESTPRYDAIEVAQYRCHHEHSVLVLGSATPSLERYYQCQCGSFSLLELPERVHKQPLPPVEIVDMREELSKGNRSIFSASLYKEIVNTLQQNEQVILFLNRRGYSTFVSCRECGHVLRCNKCDVSLTYHSGTQMLKCHYCGSEETTPSMCPNCGSRYIKYFGAGTQRVEEEIRKLLPSVRVLRMDNDTTRTKDAHMKILQAFREKRAQILIGTQMIAKGLDFPDVTLVGVVAADTTLNLPDYRSAEKTFQLVTQVAGRAGRDRKPGNVIIQTYSPNHYSIMRAAQHDYIGFFCQELENRKKCQYPPFSEFVRCLITGDQEEKVEKDCILLGDQIKQVIQEKEEWSPYILHFDCTPAPISKIMGKFRWQVLLKIMEGPETSSLIERLFNRFPGNNYEGSTLSIERNPSNMI